jgi:hypothetical protein
MPPLPPAYFYFYEIMCAIVQTVAAVRALLFSSGGQVTPFKELGRYFTSVTG